MRVPESTVNCRLVDSLHFIVSHLHWAPHKLSDSQKARQGKSTRVELSIELRDLLLSIRHQGQDEDTY
jgi:hypothetical protein